MKTVTFAPARTGRIVLLGATALAGALLTTQARAQEEPGSIGAAEPGDIVVVTGSRIARPDFQFSNPVVSVDAEQFELSGAVNLTDYLNTLPALVGSFDSNDAGGSNAFIGGAGLNLLNLRNLGTDRTLVLVNGRRHVGAVPGSASVDTNTIPITLVERVEILTGGASAIYGADGVSGVVNFVMKDDFEGVDFRAQYGGSERGGANSMLISGAVGENFANGRGNIAFAVEYGFDGDLESRDRPSLTGPQSGSFQSNPFDLGDDPDVPDEIPVTDLRYGDSSPLGAVDVDGDFFIGPDDFVGDDTPWQPGVFVPPFFASGGSGTRVGDYTVDILPQIERVSVNNFASFDLTPSVEVFTELKYVHTETQNRSQPTFDFFLLIPGDNPFIPPNIAAAAAANGLSEVLVSRDHLDFGYRGDEITRKTYRGVFGLRGDVFDGIQWEASYLYGATETDELNINNRYNDRFAAALDVVTGPDGSPTCRSNLDPTALGPNVDFQGFAEPTSFAPGPDSGCLPINVFGQANTDAAIDWIMFNSLATSKIQQHVAQGFFTGDFGFFELPGGPVSYLAGAEYRKEESDSNPAPEDTAGITFGNVLLPESGDFEVFEGFAELTAPILEGRRFFEVLSLDAAYRISDYTTVGTTHTWKVGGVWAPIEDIRFRGTYAEAVRAPNISELFSPGSQDFDFIDDPCDVTRLNRGTEFRAANCAALLSSLGVADPSSFIDVNTAAIPGTLTGNPLLEEEKAETITAGAVLRPRFIPGLTASVDWYNIDLTNAISTALPQEAADNCVDLPTLDNDFCALIVRYAGGPDVGGIETYLQRPENVAFFTTEGIDFSLNYTLDPADLGVDADIGMFEFRMVGNHLLDLAFINLPGAPEDSDKGELEAPEWQATLDLLWTKGPWTVNYGINYFSETDRYEVEEVAGDPDIAEERFLEYDPRFTHDVQVRYAFADQFSVYAGVNNLTDQMPDTGQLFYPVSATGRFFYAGVSASLDSVSEFWR